MTYLIITLFSLYMITCPINLQVRLTGVFQPIVSDMPNSRTTRQSKLFYVPNYPLTFSQRQPIGFLPTLWNKWDKLIPEKAWRSQTKIKIKSILLRDYPDVIRCENRKCSECRFNFNCNRINLLLWYSRFLIMMPPYLSWLIFPAMHYYVFLCIPLILDIQFLASPVFLILSPGLSFWNFFFLGACGN